MGKHRLPRKYGKGNPVPYETQQQILNLYKAGNSTRKVGDIIGTTNTTIFKILLKNGVKPKHKKEYCPKTGNYEIDIIEGYLQGQSTTKLAKKYNANVTTINNLLFARNIPIKKIGNYRTKTVGIDDEVISLYGNKLSMSDIGKKMGMSFAAIRDVLIRNNIKPRDNSGENNRFWKGGVSTDINYIRAWKRQNRKKRTAIDPLFKLENILRGRIANFFLRNRKNGKIKARKNNRTFVLLGANKKKIFSHIEAQFVEGMSWANHGKIWHIDHIRPLASAQTEEELIALFHYKNLQPLFAKDNIAKKDRLDWVRQNKEEK